MSKLKQKILLTGANGTLGRAIRAEAGDTIDFVCVDIVNGGDSSIHRGSFTDGELMDQLMQGCDAVIHTAALHGGNRKTHTPTQYTEVNVGGQVTLLELCVKHGVKRFVFSSTMEVHVGGDWLACGMGMLDEWMTPNPNWVYPMNKLLCEQVGLYYHRQHQIEFVALRYMWFDSVIPMNPLLLSRYIMPADVARANLLAASKPDLGYHTINIGPDSPLTQADIGKAMTDHESVVEKYWPGAVEVLKQHNIELKPNQFWPVTLIDRAWQVLGWRPVITFETYLESLGWQKS